MLEAGDHERRHDAGGVIEHGSGQLAGPGGGAAVELCRYVSVVQNLSDCFVARDGVLAYPSNPDLPTSIAPCPLSTDGLAATLAGVGAQTS